MYAVSLGNENIQSTNLSMSPILSVSEWGPITTAK